jgi:hypothetical protein
VTNGRRNCSADNQESPSEIAVTALAICCYLYRYTPQQILIWINKKRREWLKTKLFSCRSAVKSVRFLSMDALFVCAFLMIELIKSQRLYRGFSALHMPFSAAVCF